MLPSLTPMADQDLAQPAEELGGVGRRPQIGFGHDLDQRHAAAVEVEIGAPRSRRSPRAATCPASSSMWTRVMPTRRRGRRAVELDARRRWRAAGRTGRSDSPSAGRDRSSSCARRSTRGWTRQPSASAARDRQLHGSAVQHRQRAGQAEADRADVRVRRRAERASAAAEDLGGGQQLRVDLEPDDRFERWHVASDCATECYGNLRNARLDGHA